LAQGLFGWPSPSYGLVGPMPHIIQTLRKIATTSATFAVFLYEGYTYNWIFLHQILPAAGKGDLVLPFLISFNVALGLALMSYMRARVEDPGVVPQRWQEFVGSVGDQLPIAPARLEWQPGKATYCNQCGVPRPERAHHCRICGVCVLRMDHHCPWLSNCVGFKNHKYFLLAVGYGLLASLVAVITALPELIACFDVFIRLEEGQPLQNRWHLQMVDICMFLLFGLVAVTLTMLLSTMLAAHLELGAHNATSIEGHYDNMPNPFDQGTSLGNLAQIFGDFGADWFLPIAPWRPMTDGVSYERTDERIIGPGGNQMRNQELHSERIWRIRYRVREPTVKEEVSDRLGSIRSWLGGPCTDKEPLIGREGVMDCRREYSGRRYIIAL